MAYIEFDKVVKEYPSGGTSIRALDEASFTADQGELTVILGQSGAGKTTALNILGGMDTATSGRVVVGERDITGLRKRDLITYRRNDVALYSSSITWCQISPPWRTWNSPRRFVPTISTRLKRCAKSDWGSA